MEVLLIYANWCGHCQNLKKHFQELDDYFKNQKTKFIKLEESNVKDIQSYENKYKFKNQYFPFLCVFYIVNGKSKQHELPTDIEQMKQEFETLKSKLKRENFDNQQIEQTKQSDNFDITVYYPRDKKNILSIVSKYKKLAQDNGIQYNIIKDTTLKSPFFDCVVNSDNKRFYFNYDDLKRLYNLIINHKKFLGSDFLPLTIKNMIKDLLSPSETKQHFKPINHNYKQQSRLNNNKVLKCKNTFDDNGNIIASDCQTVY